MVDKATRLVEAALYISGRPLTIHEIQHATQIPTLKKVRECVQQLIGEYENRTGALEIVRLPRQRFVLQLNPELSEHVGDLAPQGLLSLGELKTLIYIALSQPILQSELYLMLLLLGLSILLLQLKRSKLYKFTEDSRLMQGLDTLLKPIKVVENEFEVLVQKTYALYNKVTGKDQYSLSNTYAKAAFLYHNLAIIYTTGISGWLIGDIAVYGIFAFF